LKKLHEARPERVVLAIRERPWCRTVTAVKDSLNHVGFTFRDGEVCNGPSAVPFIPNCRGLTWRGRCR
jgi:hypothetical protein